MALLGADSLFAGLDEIDEMRKSLAFLARFVLASSVSFCLWEAVSDRYLSTVVPATNWLLGQWKMPLALEQRQSLLLYVYERAGGGTLKLQAVDYDSVYLNLIAVASLFAATPNRELKWKLGWTFSVWIFLWATHVASFSLGGHVAIWEYLRSVPSSPEMTLLTAEMSHNFSPGHNQAAVRLLELWNMWARYGLAIGVWYLATKGQLQLFQSVKPERSTKRSVRIDLDTPIHQAPVFHASSI